MVLSLCVGIATQAQPEEPVAGYPLIVSPLDRAGTHIEYGPLADGTYGLSITGRTVLWWTILDRDARPYRHVELQADAALIQLAPRPGQTTPAPDRFLHLDPMEVLSIYLEGDVRVIEQERTITCQQLYYDLPARKALAIDAVLQTYNTVRNVPLYIRAARLRQQALDQFYGQKVIFTTSEFHLPQWSLSADSVTVTDNRVTDTTAGPKAIVVEMQDVRLMYYDKTILRLAKVRADLAGAYLPIRSVRAGYDDIWGGSVETRWYLPKVFGLQPPPWVDASLLVDYYSQRGPAIGTDVNYEQPQQFGRIRGYLIYDTGTDTLGNAPDRMNLQPPFLTRGRLTAQHRQFLPGSWQLTGEVSYLSDRNFLEQYYRQEFYCDKEQETLLHAKRIQENQGISILVKGRVNDFADTVTEIPSGQFHWIAQSFFNDRLTYYTDSYIGRLAYRPDHLGPPADLSGSFTFATTRHQLDMPLSIASVKFVPFIAAMAGYDDGKGYGIDLYENPTRASDHAFLGQAGLRVGLPTWHKVYPEVYSKLLDISQLRHLITGQLSLMNYYGKERADQRDVLALGISQRLQTRRGTGQRSRTIDWVQFNTELVFVDKDADVQIPNYILWHEPEIPLWQRRTTNIYGAARDYLGTNLLWQITDSTDLMADAYVDLADQRLCQLNLGISHVRWPDLRYYIGTRYLGTVGGITGQQASHVVTVAASYAIDPRYSLVVSSQYQLEQEKGLRHAITLIRRYHRLSYGLTISSDRSLDQISVVFGLWPQGLPEIGMGLDRHMGLGL